MLIVNLVGGLGNQMFQYAFGQSLALEKNLTVKFDTADLLNRRPKEGLIYTYRDFELDIFEGEVTKANAWEAALFRPRPASLIERIGYKILRTVTQPHIYEEYESKQFVYDPGVWKTSPYTYFNGYWQTERYFLKHEAIIRNNFTFKCELAGENKLLAQQISTQNAIGVHIRRGDYVSNTVYNQMHGTCSPEYYEQAVQYISDRVTNPILYVFSDEPDWVYQNLSFAAPTVYISHNQGKNSFEDMRLMSLCQHNIIANSSFSWWGAWLNTNPNKIVVAPRKWIQHERPENSDLIPKQWIRL